VFDYHNLSLGTIHNIVSQAVQKARQINNLQNLSGIGVGILDEIFQACQLVLVGIDARSTYCYLLAAKDQRDETTWGVHLLDLAEKGLHPIIPLPMPVGVFEPDNWLSGTMYPVIAMYSMPSVTSENLPFSLRTRSLDVARYDRNLNARWNVPRNAGRANRFAGNWPMPIKLRTKPCS